MTINDDFTGVIKRKIANRVRTATRWHKLTNEATVRQFVLDDPGIKAFIHEASEDEKMRYVVSKLVEALYEAPSEIGSNSRERYITELRRVYGAIVDLVVEALNEQRPE